MKRAALIAGVSLAVLACVGPTQVLALSDSTEFWSGRQRSFSPYVPAWNRPSRRAKEPERRPSKADRAADKAPPSPSGPLHVIVSIDKQRATLFDNGVPIASTAISTGTLGHPTPMGVFTVIQKSRHHVSNLYDAPMPYMQRITWSGSALHEGPLPGYPASHGCVRLSGNFAQVLWKTTKMGARVIVTRPEVAPVEIEHARLFVPRPKVAFEPATTSALVKTGVTEPVAIARRFDTWRSLMDFMVEKQRPFVTTAPVPVHEAPVAARAQGFVPEGLERLVCPSRGALQGLGVAEQKAGRDDGSITAAGGQGLRERGGESHGGTQQPGHGPPGEGGAGCSR